MTEDTSLDETGFDAELRALAARIMDEERVPPSFFGQAWRENGLFTAMQCYAAQNVGTAHKADILATCEALGRDAARLHVERV